MGCIYSKSTDVNLQHPLLVGITISKEHDDSSKNARSPVLTPVSTPHYGLSLEMPVSSSKETMKISQSPDDSFDFPLKPSKPTRMTSFALKSDVKLNGRSIIYTPPSEYLLRRTWINKRGHMLRTWKKRYCVLEKNELKYYQSADPNPPYGKSLKGQIALLGAVCSVSLSGGMKNDPLRLCVEIFGDKGEKDLFFELDFNEEAQVLSLKLCR